MKIKFITFSQMFCTILVNREVINWENSFCRDYVLLQHVLMFYEICSRTIFSANIQFVFEQVFFINDYTFQRIFAC